MQYKAPSATKVHVFLAEVSGIASAKSANAATVVLNSSTGVFFVF